MYTYIVTHTHIHTQTHTHTHTHVYDTHIYRYVNIITSVEKMKKEGPLVEVCKEQKHARDTKAMQVPSPNPKT
jgi:hypothetical protein